MMSSEQNEWFRTWFDSPYYSLLYKNRSEEEAAAFMEALNHFLLLPDRARVLDLACGKGRHSIHLRNHGYRVIGIDLSANSIAFAKKFEDEHLHFLRDDMRTFDLPYKFDAVFNLFTSFGYFDSLSENMKVLENVHSHLRENGRFVIDYFNSEKVKRTYVPFEKKEENDVLFEIKKTIDSDNILKTIEITSHQKKMTFQEKVQLIAPSTLTEMLEKAGFQISSTFGDYMLSPFDEVNSDRFIVIGTKR